MEFSQTFGSAKTRRKGAPCTVDAEHCTIWASATYSIYRT